MAARGWVRFGGLEGLILGGDGAWAVRWGAPQRCGAGTLRPGLNVCIFVEFSAQKGSLAMARLAELMLVARCPCPEPPASGAAAPQEVSALLWEQGWVHRNPQPLFGSETCSSTSPLPG